MPLVLRRAIAKLVPIVMATGSAGGTDTVIKSRKRSKIFSQPACVSVIRTHRLTMVSSFHDRATFHKVPTYTDLKKVVQAVEEAEQGWGEFVGGCRRRGCEFSWQALGGDDAATYRCSP